MLSRSSRKQSIAIGASNFVNIGVERWTGLFNVCFLVEMPRCTV